MKLEVMLEKLAKDTIVAIGCGNEWDGCKRMAGGGSSFVFIGTVKDFYKDLEGIDKYYSVTHGRFNKGVPIVGYKSFLYREVKHFKKREVPTEPESFAIFIEGEERGAYFLKCEYDKVPQEPYKIKNPDGIENLRLAIIERAIIDYSLALNDGYEEWRGRESCYCQKELDKFFKSSYGEMITSADGEQVIKAVRKKAKNMRYHKEVKDEI